MRLKEKKKDIMVFKKKEADSNILQTIKEEVFNSISHGLGIILGISSFILLLFNIKISFPHIFSYVFYCSSLLILYTISTLYHAIPHKKAKQVLRKLDHISIFLLILGSYIPITLISLNGLFGWILFSLMMCLSVFGIIFKIIFGTRFGLVSTILYLLTGWSGVLAFKPLFFVLPIKGFAWLVIGGLFYSLGVIFYSIDRKFYFFHTIWHIFVLMGSFSHFILFFGYVFI